MDFKLERDMHSFAKARRLGLDISPAARKTAIPVFYAEGLEVRSTAQLYSVGHRVSFGLLYAILSVVLCNLFFGRYGGIVFSFPTAQKLKYQLTVIVRSSRNKNFSSKTLLWVVFVSTPSCVCAFASFFLSCL